MGQTYAKKVLAVAVYNHYKRLSRNLPSGQHASKSQETQTSVVESRNVNAFTHRGKPIISGNLVEANASILWNSEGRRGSIWTVPHWFLVFFPPVNCSDPCEMLFTKLRSRFQRPCISITGHIGSAVVKI